MLFFERRMYTVIVFMIIPIIEIIVLNTLNTKYSWYNVSFSPSLSWQFVKRFIFSHMDILAFQDELVSSISYELFPWLHEIVILGLMLEFYNQICKLI